MSNIKKELIDLLNQALQKEHAAINQYRSHAELINGINAEPIIARLMEIAGDEEKHAGKFRKLIGNYLGGVPTMDLSETHKAKGIPAILKVNLKDEKDAIDFYKQILQKILENKKDLPYIYVTLEHEVRHIILDEEEHVAELSTLLGTD